MLRFTGFTIVCFLSPFIAYGAWRFITAGIVPGREVWATKVWMRLSGAGILATLLAIAILVHLSGGEAGRTYHPARFENGQLIPGAFD
ncbi:DUF6111 family protein [Kaistia dalseonensis]|uniref:Sec-independent protein secretion pathway component TatC n=1 Tax=Kaistia dalseonensis TaxID=410840 RepID=A0ABU0H654_9HYPH|nr:DUF6111 family protein [Kaistia dalseonensis]MCX5495209.1 DUF6111 family protein [Kaistia dalseonensis]MDQ0437794.1 Sec-independent protein secretion pathway component TatC [Kaistia dalseonensis]